MKTKTKALFLLGEVVNWTLFERSLKLNRKITLKDLNEYEIQSLDLLSKNRPKTICLWLADFMRDNGFKFSDITYTEEDLIK